ncbi:MAG: DUF6798 domain-containing protein [Bacteroidota bacterium]
MVSAKNILVFLAGFFLFSCLFYGYFGFQFGDNNNREELPLIYEKITSEVLFPNDHFVKQHATSYTQITPFLSTISFFLYGADLSKVKLTFLILHVVTLLFLFLILHSFLHKLSRFSTLQSAVFIFILSLFIDKFIPSGRWLFINFFDPEWLTITIIFGFFFMHLTQRYLAAFILISIAGILYPIYIIPIFPAILFLIYLDEFKVSKIKAIQLVVAYASIPAVYTIFLWLISRQSPNQPFDASFIMEYIRAPWHYKIPSIHFMNKKSVGYAIFILPFLYFGRMLKSESGFDGSVYRLIVGIFLTLLVTSIIHSIVRIPLIVQISPYRIGLFSTTLGFLLIPTLLSRNFKIREKLFQFKIHKYIYGTLTILLFGFLSYLLQSEYHQNEVSPEIAETKEWIQNNTSSEDLFLNYSGIAIRTQCLRSSYFEFKTIPLTADGQMEWYWRFMRYNKSDQIIHPLKVSENLEKGWPMEQFNIFYQDKFDALEYIDEPVRYLITQASDTVTIEKNTPIFLNGQYAIFKIPLQ